MSKTALKVILSIVISITTVVLISVVYWQKNLPLVSPVAFIESIYQPSTKNKRIVYGFLPYWNLKYAKELQINHLTHLAYFGLDLKSDGTANKKVNARELEPGWNKLNSDTTKNILYQSKLLNQKTVLTVTAMEPEIISSIVNNQTYTQNSINDILQVYKDFNFDGINIDFEYVGIPDEVTKKNFTNYIKLINQECKKSYPKCFIDIDIFGDTAEKNRLWNLEELHPHVSHIIVMAYDYYRKSSSQAGPVAPLTGSCKGQSDNPCLEHDILQHISLITKKVPQNKIILGIPFYGYEWQTASEDFLANTYPKTGSIATYQRIQEIITNPETSSLSAKWSNSTLSPYLVYYEDKKIKQIHYENQQSLKLKIDVLNATNLGGMAIWALGYEVPYQDLWQPIFEMNR